MTDVKKEMDLGKSGHESSGSKRITASTEPNSLSKGKMVAEENEENFNMSSGEEENFIQTRLSEGPFGKKTGFSGVSRRIFRKEKGHEHPRNARANHEDEQIERKSVQMGQSLNRDFKLKQEESLKLLSRISNDFHHAVNADLESEKEESSSDSESLFNIKQNASRAFDPQKPIVIIRSQVKMPEAPSPKEPEVAYQGGDFSFCDNFQFNQEVSEPSADFPMRTK